MSRARIVRIVGAVVEAAPVEKAGLYQLAQVGERGLLAEVIRIQGDRATLQVFEDTAGLRLGEPVLTLGESVSATLGPGLLGAIFDGVGRPLAKIAESTGHFIPAGVDLPMLDPKVSWRFQPAVRPGSEVSTGDVLGFVEEAPGLEHRIMVPPGVTGRIAELDSGEYNLADPVGRLSDGTLLRLSQRWPIRKPRPAAERLPPARALVTGQRVLDLLFPVADGGSVALPGGFGTGKTVLEQVLAKYVDADLVVYVGCGERGNEMAEMLHAFRELRDPRNNRLLLERTVLVVNTSNMPVVAREGSVDLGMTIAEYYRDMGYRTAVMVDSLSRWAEALREVSGRLEEMPGEEGYPASLPSRVARLYERAGRVRSSGSPERSGSVTLISAVSPPGGDFSEPVTQASLRVAGGLWALDTALAHQRHFPAVSWQTSYSLYADRLGSWFEKLVGGPWTKLREGILALLQRDQELREIVSLVGTEGLEDLDRLQLEVARLARALLLAQSAMDPNDAYSPPEKTYLLADLLLALLEAAKKAIGRGVPLDALDLDPVKVALVAVRDSPPGETADLARHAREAIKALGAKVGGKP